MSFQISFELKGVDEHSSLLDEMKEPDGAAAVVAVVVIVVEFVADNTHNVQGVVAVVVVEARECPLEYFVMYLLESNLYLELD